MSTVKQEPPRSEDGAPEELLGSLTTYSSVHAGGEAGGPAVRTSARVIKKLRLDSSDQRERKDSAKLDVDKPEKEYTVVSSTIKIISAKQRMPKALWSAAEKNLFFEALNEHGKDFDSITAYICTKLKRKGFTDATTKTKHQVSQFYYRTWNKVSKHIKFSDDVKKVVQELYALINYGEMRKRLELGVASRTASRLPELVSKGVVAVRERGRTLRVRTPVCRALRRLNQLEEWDEHLRLPSRVIVTLTPRDSEAWARVQGAAHNPRALAPAAPPLRLLALLGLLQRRWRNHSHDLRDILSTSLRKQSFESFNSLNQQIQMLLNPTINIQHSPLSLKIQNMPSLPRNMRANIHELSKLNKSIGNIENNVDVTQKKDAKTNGLDGILPRIEDSTISTEDTAQKSSNGVTQNNNRKSDECLDESFKTVDSTSKTEEVKNIVSHVDSVTSQKLNDPVSKNFAKWLESDERRDEDDTEKKWKVAYGIKDNLVLHVGPKPGLNLNFPTININEHVTSQRICLTAYQERIGNNPINSSNGLQSDVGFKGGGSRFKKRNRKDSGDNDPNKKNKLDGDNCDMYMKEVLDIDETANDGMDMVAFSDGKNITDGLAFEEDKDFLSELEDDEKDNNETDGESDVPAKAMDPTDDKNLQMDKFPNLKVKLRDRTKKDKSSVPSSITDSPEDPPRVSAATSNFLGKSWNRDFVLQQIKKGWSVYDAGDLTVGDMYLMFGSESKLELNYWWAEATPPIPPTTVQQMKQAAEQALEGSAGGPVSAAAEEASERMLNADEILLSPTHHSSQDSNDVDERRELMSPDHKTIPHVPEDPSTSSAFPLVSKIINFPCQSGNPVQSSGADSEFSPPIVPEREKIVTIGGRLKKLLSIAKMHDRRRRVGCSCGHFCGGARGKRSTAPKDDTLPKTSASSVVSTPEQQGPSTISPTMKEVFRAPLLKTGLLIHPASQQPSTMKTVADLELNKLPKWTRRGKQANSKPPVHKPKQAAMYRCPPILPRGPYIVAVPADAPAPPPPAAPAPLLRVLPAIRPRPLVPVVRQNIDRFVTYRPPANFSKIDVPIQDSGCDVARSVQLVKSESISLTNLSEQVTVYPPPSEGQTHWEGHSVDPGPSSAKNESKDVTPNLANLLDISLPSNIGDDNSLGIPLKVESNGNVEKHENFTGLLPAESMSMSPSRLLKDDQWLESEVHNFSLSSFLGHLEAGRGKGSEGGKGEESVDGHLHSLMGETSIDYMAKFEDLAARVGAEATK